MRQYVELFLITFRFINREKNYMIYLFELFIRSCKMCAWETYAYWMEIEFWHQKFWFYDNVKYKTDRKESYDRCYVSFFESKKKTKKEMKNSLLLFLTQTYRWWLHACRTHTRHTRSSSLHTYVPFRFRNLVMTLQWRRVI